MELQNISMNSLGQVRCSVGFGSFGFSSSMSVEILQ